MLVNFTVESAQAFWKMVCLPSTHWKVEDWYRCESTVAEIELCSLHKFADSKLCETKKKDINGQEVEEKHFNGGTFSLREELVDRAKKVVEHFREIAKAGRGGLLPLHFAELEAGLRNKPMPGDDVADPADAEALAKLQGETKPGVSGLLPCEESR